MEIILAPKAKKRGFNLYPFQYKGVRWMLDCPNTRLYLADDMGLGKTIQLFTYANSIQAVNLLVTVPASLRLNWAREAATWFAMSKHPAKAILSSRDFFEMKKDGAFKKGFLPTPFIVSYDLLVKCEPLRNYVLRRKWDLICSDEVDNVRNISAQRTQIMGDIWDTTADIVFMSGTPIDSSAADLYPAISKIAQYSTQLSSREKELLTDFNKFTEMFTYKYKSIYGEKYRGCRNHNYLRKLIYTKGNFFLRRTEEQVHAQLPSHRYKPVYLSANFNTVGDEEDIENLMDAYESDEVDDDAFEKDASMALFRKELGMMLAECNEVYEYIEQLIRTGNPVVIFTWHRDVLRLVADTLKKYSPVTMHGGMTPAQKQRSVDEFQNGETDVIIGNLHSLGTGWTLTRAADTIHLEPDWRATKIRQGAKRVHRIGQTRPCTAHFIMTRNTFHQRMVATAIRKYESAKKVLEG